MLKIKYFLLIFLWAFVNIPNLLAFQYENTYMDRPIEQNHFDKNKWKETVKDIDYSADVGAAREKRKGQKRKQNKPTPSTSLWKAGEGFFTFMKLLVILGGVIIIALILARVIGAANEPKDKKINPTADIKNLNINEVAENIHDTNLNILIQKALDINNYSLAIRLYYLLIIKELSLKNHIKWKKDKTNGDYLNELKDTSFFQPFYQTTSIFERIWYGDINLQKTAYEHIEPQLKTLIQTIKREN